MKNIFRSILKTVLGRISSKVISKHNTEVIVVTGWTGTAVVRELIYHLLSEKFQVRRNVKKIWWDLSLPLTILGYEDKRRTFFEWIALIVKAAFNLVFKKKYTHKLIVDIDTSNNDTACFWSDFLSPNIVVALKQNPKSRLLNKFLSEKGSERTYLVFNPHNIDLSEKISTSFTYSKQGADLAAEHTDGKLVLSYQSENVSIKIPEISVFLSEFIPPAFAVGILQGIKLKKLSDKIESFDLHPQQYKKAFRNLKKFIEKDE